MYLANEFCELQAQKHLSSSFILIIFLVFAEGFNWKNLSLIKTSLDVASEGQAMESYPLVFFTVAFTVFLIGLVGYFSIMLTQWLNPNSYVEFVDLCSLANMSVLMFDAELKGFYIHG